MLEGEAMMTDEMSHYVSRIKPSLVPHAADLHLTVCIGGVEVGSIVLPPNVHAVTCRVRRPYDDTPTVLDFEWREE